MVLPVVAIVEGVLNGFLVPNEEIEKFVTAWEGAPIPVNHPQVNGIHVSANLPQILESRVIGRFHNVRAEDSRLKGEIWLDVHKAADKGFGDVIEAFTSGQMMEVSTAYFADTEPTQGIFNGKRYSGIHRNLRPDHLAVLPNETGACSIADGCGALRANQEEKGFFMGTLQKLRNLFSMPSLGLETNEESMTERVRAVRQAVDAMDGHGEVFYLVDVFDDSAIYENDGKMYRRSYQLGEDGVATFTSEPEQVRMEKSFVPVANESEAEAEDDLPEESGETPETNEDEAMSDNDQAQAPQLDAETLTAVNWAREKYDAEKDRLVKRLTANAACAFDESDLNAMHVNELEKLDRSLSPRDYSGQGMPVTHQANDEEPLASPEPIVLKAVGGDE